MKSLLLCIHAVPGSKKTQAAGLYGDALKLKIAAQPVDGKANEAIKQWLAKTFGVRLASIELKSGLTSREKRFELSVPDDAALKAAQERWQILLNGE